MQENDTKLLPISFIYNNRIMSKSWHQIETKERKKHLHNYQLSWALETTK